MEEAPTFGKFKTKAQGYNAVGLEEHKMTCEVETILITDFYNFFKYSKKSGTELFLLKNTAFSRLLYTHACTYPMY